MRYKSKVKVLVEVMLRFENLTLLDQVQEESMTPPPTMFCGFTVLWEVERMEPPLDTTLPTTVMVLPVRVNLKLLLETVTKKSLLKPKVTSWVRVKSLVRINVVLKVKDPVPTKLKEVESVVVPLKEIGALLIHCPFKV